MGVGGSRNRGWDHRGDTLVHPALAGVARDHGRGSRYPQRSLCPVADPADVIPRALAIRPAAVADHERPEHDSPIAVLRADLSDAQPPSDHRGDDHPACDVLATGSRGAALRGTGHRNRAALRAHLHPIVTPGSGPGGARGHRSRGGGVGTAGGQVLRARGLCLRPVR